MSRTFNLLIRSQLLYPIELRMHSATIIRMAIEAARICLFGSTPIRPRDPPGTSDRITPPQIVADRIVTTDVTKEVDA